MMPESIEECASLRGEAFDPKDHSRTRTLIRLMLESNYLTDEEKTLLRKWES